MAARNLAARGLASDDLAERFYSETPTYNSSYGYANGNPISFTDPEGLIPGDKTFGITDPGFWKWWEKSKYDWGPFLDKDGKPFNPAKPFDLPNKTTADLMKEEYEQCKKRDAGGVSNKTRGKARGGRGSRGGWNGSD